MTPRAEDRYRLLTSLAQLVGASLDLRKVFWRAAEQLHALLGCQRITLLLAAGVLERHDGFSVEFGEEVRWINLPAGPPRDFAPRAMTGEADETLRGAGYRRLACLPLVCRARVIGELTLATRGQADWDLAFLEEVAVILATALDNAAAYAEIARLKRQVEQANVYLRAELEREHGPDLVGGLPAVRQAIEQVAATDSTVLILGATGTGKELVARAIHERSPRRGQLLVKVNCGALPPTLITSELFGHEAGAFTGATRRRQGRFELAHRGTLFLDEVGELPADAQVLLLRVLQERQIERVGGNRPLPVDVRVLAATHRDLKQDVEAGRFRADLYFRLHVFPIRLPTLRERLHDLPDLVRHFIDRFNRRMNQRIERVGDDTLQLLGHYHWPGNVRELENIIERAMIVSRGPVLEIDPTWLTGPAAATTGSLAEQERGALIAALEQAGGKVYGPGGAAESLGLKPTTLYGKLRKHGIRKKANSTRYE